MNADFLNKALVEYAASLKRMESEKDHQASIVATVKETCNVEPGHFKKYAAAQHKNKIDDLYQDTGALMALIDTVRAA